MPCQRDATGIFPRFAPVRVESTVGPSPAAPTPSPALLAAQERLLALRAEVRGKGEEQRVVSSQWPVVSDQWSVVNGQLAAKVGALPAHLGWGTAPLTRHLRNQVTPASTDHAPLTLDHSSLSTDHSSLTTDHSSLTTDHSPAPRPPAPAHPLAPSLALAFLRHRVVAPARVWLLLRHLDGDGRGWVTVAEARARLTGRDAPLRLCGWRQLRNLLRAGEGRFWKRSADRIWLRSTARVAAALGVARLHGRSVAFPIAHLHASIAQTRAHLYATFHSSRGHDRPAAPVARATLAALGGVSRRSQRRYESAAGVRRAPNYAAGSALNQGAWRDAAWQRGRAVFPLRDANGRFGRPGAAYIAWQLPNSYHGPHAPVGRGRQRRINRRLADLSLQGMTGNDAPVAITPGATRYFGNGRLAGRAYNRDPHADRYWRDHGRSPRKRRSGGNGRGGWWSFLPGQDA